MAGLDKMKVANVLAVTTAIVWVICAGLVIALPDLTLTMSQWMLHGLDLTVLGGWQLTVANFVLGGLTWTASAWITGWLFGWVWERLN